MKLIDNLYSINARELDNMGDKAIFGISLNADNVIYKAHFPSNPITPGVCLIQIALEITELCKNTDLEIKKLKNVKFTSQLNPIQSPDINVEISGLKNENSEVTVVFRDEQTVFSKISLILKNKQ